MRPRRTRLVGAATLLLGLWTTGGQAAEPFVPRIDRHFQPAQEVLQTIVSERAVAGAVGLVLQEGQSIDLNSDGDSALRGTGDVQVSEETLFGDLDCFRIVTPTATYLYGMRGAGFAGIIDGEGRDWISYRHGGQAAGEYRGLPKCGQPTKFFHCGYGFGQYENDNWFISQIVRQEPEHVRIHSETRNGDSACDWDFFPTHATLTLLCIGAPAYWFLYEGTPGGALDPDTDFVVRPGNRRTFLKEPWSDHVPWVYFGSGESSAALYLICHQRHEAVDSYVSWPYKPEPDGSLRPEMTVFGFGRPDWRDPNQHTPPLTGLPARWSIGFAETTEYKTVTKRIEAVRQHEETFESGP